MLTVSDSEYVRKAIFEILVGKKYPEYYESIAEEKKYKKERDLKKSVLNEYQKIYNNIKHNKKKYASTDLKKEIEDSEKQLKNLYKSRSSFKSDRNNVFPIIDDLKKNIINIELRLSKENEDLINLYDDRYKLLSVKNHSENEIKQIQKIIFSHEKMNLFKINSCPHCLNTVDRKKNHCVCGAEINEEGYEKFLYSSEEYKDILKQKIKSFETIKTTYDECSKEIAGKKYSISYYKEEIERLRTKINCLLNKIDCPDDTWINQFDDKILEVREKINTLQRSLKIEEEIQKFESQYEQAIINWIDQSIQRREPIGSLMLGWFYENGICVEQSIERAAYFYSAARDLGSPEADLALDRLFIRQIEEKSGV